MRRVKAKRKQIMSDIEELSRHEGCELKKRWRINIFRHYDARLKKNFGDKELMVFVKIAREMIIAKIENMDEKEEFSRITIAAKESETDIDVPNYSVYTRPTAKPEFDKYFNIVTRDSIKVTFRILTRTVIDAISGLAQKNASIIIGATNGIYLEADLHPSYKADLQRIINMMHQLKENLDRIV